MSVEVMVVNNLLNSRIPEEEEEVKPRDKTYRIHNK